MYKYPIGSLTCKLFNNSELDCQNRNLSSIPPLDTNITSLNLFYNKLTELSSSTFDGQNHLAHLDLSFNQINYTAGSPFFNLVNLKTLKLNNNGLISLESSTFDGLTHLLTLDLSYNWLRNLSLGVFSYLSNLKDLYLNANSFSRIPSEAFAPLHSLKVLDLTINPLTSITLGVAFQNLTKLESLGIYSEALLQSQNTPNISNDTFQNLANVPLDDLALLWDGITPTTAEKGLLKPLKNLTKLKSFFEVFDALPSLESNLQLLKMFVFPDEHRFTNTTFKSLAKWSLTLQHLDVRFSVLGNIDGYAFKWFPNVRHLDLGSVSLPPLTFSEHAFFGLNHLEELILLDNHLNTISSKIFSDFAETSSLRRLDLSFNSLSGRFPEDIFEPISSLTHLNLMHNPIGYIGSWINKLQNLTELNLGSITSQYYLQTQSWTKALQNLHTLYLNYPQEKKLISANDFLLKLKAPNLENVNLAETFVTNINVIEGLLELKELDVTGSFIEMDDFYTQWGKVYFPKLETLNLASNKISHITKTMFSTTTPQVANLNLSSNGLENIDPDAFTSLPLRYLNLANNALLSLDWIPPKLPFIHTLLIPQNGIAEVPSNFFKVIQSSPLQVLDLSGNQFSCGCEVEPFRKWILANKTVFLTPTLGYKCNSPKSLSGISITQVNQDCTSYFFTYLTSGLVGAVLLLIAIALAVHYRWHIRYKMFLLCTWRRKYETIPPQADLNANIQEVRYDAFVSYAHDSDEDLRWVLEELRPNMEECDDPLKLCIGHARDFIPGTPLIEAITSSIHNSTRTIAILSPQYVDSEWCYYEMQHAWLRLMDEGQDVIILILLEPIPDDKMTMWLRQFLCKKGCLKWPKDKPGQRLFWQMLREKLRMQRTHVNRRYDT